jgi:OPA family sugar phosphate sensor protein UhpC-like MFS transporter
MTPETVALPRKPIFGRLARVYAIEPAAAPLTDPERIRKTYLHWRVRMLVLMFLAYFFLYFCRKNISATLPLIGKDLGYTNTQLGILGSTLYITYGIGKATNGILADRANIRRFIATSLIISGVLSAYFGSLASLWALALVWGLNGWIQSMGFPPMARALTIWYEKKGNATRWALWTCSHQSGTAAILALSGVILYYSNNNWRLCFVIPGALCVLMGFAVLLGMADTPESKGLPPVKGFAQEAPGERDKQPYWPVFFSKVLWNPQIWVIGIVNLCDYTVRFGTLDWMTKFLAERKGYSIAQAAAMTSTMPDRKSVV